MIWVNISQRKWWSGQGCLTMHHLQTTFGNGGKQQSTISAKSSGHLAGGQFPLGYDAFEDNSIWVWINNSRGWRIRLEVSIWSWWVRGMFASS